MVHNRAAIAERMRTVARLLDLPTPGFDAVLSWVLDFRRQLKIPHTLAEIGVNTNNSAVIGTEAAALG